MTNIFYFTCGEKERNHFQCILSIFSIMQWKKEGLRFTVFTDKPEFYNIIRDKIEIVHLTPELMKEWRGSHDFIWRLKIMSVAAIAEKYPDDHLLYLDSDTFSAESIEKIIDLLNSGHTIMHMNEGKLAEIKTKTFRYMLEDLNFKKVMGVEINRDTVMYNAGVIGIPKDRLELTARVVKMCDELLDFNIRRNNILEQLSFSIVLSVNQNIRMAKGMITHYWADKAEWDAKMEKYFSKIAILNPAPEQRINLLEEYEFASMPWRIKRKSIKKRLFNLINKIIKDKYWY